MRAIAGITTLSLFAQISRKKLETEGERRGQSLSLLVCNVSMNCLLFCALELYLQEGAIVDKAIQKAIRLTDSDSEEVCVCNYALCLLVMLAQCAGRGIYCEGTCSGAEECY